MSKKFIFVVNVHNPIQDYLGKSYYDFPQSMKKEKNLVLSWNYGCMYRQL